MKDFTMLPNNLLKLAEERKIDPYDIAVYFAIFSHKNTKTGKCFPSLRRIEKITGITVKTIRSRIDNLKKCGMLYHTKTKGVVSKYSTVVPDTTDCGTPYHVTIRKNNTNNYRPLKGLQDLESLLKGKNIIN
jgi:hypothetical protein